MPIDEACGDLRAVPHAPRLSRASNTRTEQVRTWEILGDDEVFGGDGKDEIHVYDDITWDHIPAADLIECGDGVDTVHVGAVKDPNDSPLSVTAWVGPRCDGLIWLHLQHAGAVVTA